MGVREDVTEVKKDVEQSMSFAMEMLKELKSQNRRQHITIIILITVIIAMIFGFFIYENQFEVVGENTTIDSKDNSSATYYRNTGDINYGKDNS